MNPVAIRERLPPFPSKENTRHLAFGGQRRCPPRVVRGHARECVRRHTRSRSREGRHSLVQVAVFGRLAGRCPLLPCGPCPSPLGHRSSLALKELLLRAGGWSECGRRVPSRAPGRDAGLCPLPSWLLCPGLALDYRHLQFRGRKRNSDSLQTGTAPAQGAGSGESVLRLSLSHLPCHVQAYPPLTGACQASPLLSSQRIC